ncbi:acetylornithine deacetylase [Alkalilimnicola sp. S0819]|uniref:acetylornithine deacetylase n=1 Tax=Alkalilimnicola sp. S0819 TaxID=2613922 RepID=UPI0012615999|nr:acetylornithine deacetylase [Alkalilimnicola sp. S0819]KAB7623010.1 acetylornithine deacetylase [Alkalilimnicola sp. S0819]MPQ17122.1 acetylornithine deacetylase [Alkalilimnicola sp. S0819]
MNTPDLRHMLEALIATPSVSSVDPALDQGNHAVTELLAEWAEALGFAVEIQPVPEGPGKSNLIATLGRGEGGLVLAGHTDTVPFDGELWASDPFRLSERDGRYYGLGTSDMKSFLALALEAARGLRAEDMRRPLVILATADEESGMTGAKALLDAGRHYGRHAVIGEPTGMRPVRMHKGMMMEAVRIEGRSGHSSDPSLGLNALEAMTEVLNEIRAWRGELQGRYRDPRFQVPVPTLNLGYLHAGDNPNRICGHAELHIDLRPLPGMGLEALREELDQRLRARLGEGMGRLSVRSLFPGLPAMETPAAAPIVAACEQLTGSEAGAVAFGTEGPFFRELGMDVVIMGPGDIEQAHQPDEYLRLDRIEPTVAQLRSLIERFCLRPEETST